MHLQHTGKMTSLILCNIYAGIFVPFWQDRIIARLQQPYSLDCIPVEAEFQVGHSIKMPIFLCSCFGGFPKCAKSRISYTTLKFSFSFYVCIRSLGRLFL